VIDLTLGGLFGGEEFELAETDMVFRARILAAVDPSEQDVIFAVTVSSGKALDLLGAAYDLFREIGPIIDAEIKK